MLNITITFKLLMMPIIWMGIVQVFFGCLSMYIFHDHVTLDFLKPGGTMIAVGTLFMFLLTKVDLSKASFRDALAYTTLTWFIVGALGAIPIISITHISITDAFFESVSALTTTGATVLSGLDHMQPTFLMYRQFLQWMGGLGIVIFVVAVLPMLNVGGMRLLKSETPGPVKNDKLSPRIANTARYLWGIYLLITTLCIIAYYAGGMTFYDAVAHAFTTVSTGGFSTHDASMWYYESHTLLWISNIFMIAGAINFALHFRVLHKKDFNGYFKDEETRVFLYIILALSILLAIYLFFQNFYSNFFESFSFAIFHIISFITSTGFGAASYTEWPIAAACMLVMTGFLGGCAGSTAGGNKIVRNILTYRIIGLNIKQLINPNRVFVIRYQNNSVSQDIQSATIVFMFLVALSTIFLTFLMILSGLDVWSAFSAVSACLNVLGPGFGQVGSNFQPVTDFGTWVLSIAMVLGRLEYFTILALFSAVFWRK